MNSKRPSALIAEDEPLLAAALAAELAKAWPDLHVVATVGDGASAVEQALKLKPDVLFFDIRMPGLSGLEAAAELADAWDPASQPFPALAFVTAYDQYAVEAFETNALDYVLKPVQPERLAKTVQKLRLSIERHVGDSTKASPTDTALQSTAQQLAQLMAALQPVSQASAPGPRLRQLQVSSAAGSQVIRMVPLSEVLYLQAADKYVRVVASDGEHLLRTPLKELLPQIDVDEFWQIHRSTVVRASAIESVQRDESGKYLITLRNHPDQLPVSRLYSHLFKPM
ncbi:LytR/AlgR family response regulator transcription factor [Ottowia thiooxydans]|uniref:LytR/AlgR family response regulator transcription factor n=1 Tax=Ottowia thiooxydans TaxID=219182 RepID=UPI0003F5390F|nr:LytTR family DNA-binding domain-containing protein [Ottowia thiooxydans]